MITTVLFTTTIERLLHVSTPEATVAVISEAALVALRAAFAFKAATKIIPLVEFSHSVVADKDQS